MNAARIKIFLSYSHQDWEPGSESEVSEHSSRLFWFADRIKKRLSVSSDHSYFQLVQDQTGALDYGDEIKPTIEEVIGDADLFLLALSRNYVKSPETTVEYDRIVKLGKPIFYIDLDCPGDVIKKTPKLAQKGWAKRLETAKKYLIVNLWDKPDGPGTSAVLLPPYTPQFELPENSEFSRKAVACAQKIEEFGHEILVGKSVSSEEGGQAAKNSIGHHFDVVVGETAGGLGELVGDFSALMDRSNLNVLQLNLESMLPEAVDRVVREAHVFVQFFGNAPGRAIDSLPLTEWQAKNWLSDGIRPMFWMGDFVALIDLDPKYREFLESLDYQCVPMEKFAKSVVKKVNKSRKKMVARNKLAEAGRNASVVIDAHPNDAEFARIVIEEFESDFQVSAVPAGSEAYDSALDQVENDDVQGIVLINGPSEEGCTQTFVRLSNYRKRVALSKSGHLAIGDPPSPTPPPAGGGIHIMTIRNGKIVPEEKKKFVASFFAA